MNSMTMTKLAKSKERRAAFVESEITVGIPFQIRALREKHRLNQSRLGKLAGMKQEAISRLETPGAGSMNLKTLLKLADALDVALIVKFAAFSELLDFSNSFRPDEFYVPPFNTEMTDPAVSGKPIDSSRLLQAIFGATNASFTANSKIDSIQSYASTYHLEKIAA